MGKNEAHISRETGEQATRLGQGEWQTLPYPDI
jgi:hypothetical protein